MGTGVTASLLAAVAVLLAAGSAAPTATIASTAPADIASLLPGGHIVIGRAHLKAGSPKRDFLIVALSRVDERPGRASDQPAGARPLLILERRNDRFVVVGRNDRVVLRSDEGGQCDPFLDGGGTISVKGRFFTVENGVACGQHWTDFVTFRLDDRAGFVFDNERSESWSLNPSDAPDADALVRDGPQRVRRDLPRRLTRFSDWRPVR